MKTFNKTNFIILGIIVLGITVFTSCSKDKDTEPADADPAEYPTLIVGKWDIYTESYFQENGSDSRVFMGKDEKSKMYEFTENGKLKTETDPKGQPYSVSGRQLIAGEATYTITKLDKKKLVFEKIVGRNTEQGGKTGVLYGVYTGTKQ